MLKTIALPARVNARNAIECIAIADEYIELGAAALVPEYETDAEALRTRVVRELAHHVPKYSKQVQVSERGQKRLVPVQKSALARKVARIMAAVAAAARGVGKASGAPKAEQEEIPEELLAAAARLAKLAAKYEKARSLANRALSAAFAAK